MRRSGPTFQRVVCLAAMMMTPVAPTTALAVTAGVDIAAPRVAMSTVDAATIAFHPARIVVERNDHVRWQWQGGSHNTTSGSPCTASGLWSSALNTLTTSFTRQFAEQPTTIPYFCAPHCGLGMNGQVVITTAIDVRAILAAGGAVKMDWTGGSGLYRIFRSTSPLFTAGTTTVLAGVGVQGLNAITFTDASGVTPAVGTAHFYLVMNHF